MVIALLTLCMEVVLATLRESGLFVKVARAGVLVPGWVPALWAREAVPTTKPRERSAAVRSCDFMSVLLPVCVDALALRMGNFLRLRRVKLINDPFAA